MRTRPLPFALLIAAVALATVSAAGGAAPNDPPRFRAAVDLVALDVCVRDASGRLVPDLSMDDFVVLENGKRQRLEFLAPSDGLPLTVVLLLDRSGSMDGRKLQQAVEAATAFATMLRPEDRLEILGFNDRTVRLHGFDDERSRVPEALARVHAIGSTSLYDAMLVAASSIVRARRDGGPETREAIIVLTDGEDMGSRVDFDEVLPALRRSGAVVYSVSLRTDIAGQWLGANWQMLATARDTGGRAAGVHGDELAALYREINTELRHMYRLGYVSGDARRDGTWRTVSVRVPAHDSRVRTRSGYYAPRTGTGPR